MYSAKRKTKIAYSARKKNRNSSKTIYRSRVENEKWSDKTRVKDGRRNECTGRQRERKRWMKQGLDNVRREDTYQKNGLAEWRVDY